MLKRCAPAPGRSVPLFALVMATLLAAPAAGAPYQGIAEIIQESSPTD
jgi:hypothetical protein